MWRRPSWGCRSEPCSGGGKRRRSGSTKSCTAPDDKKGDATMSPENGEGRPQGEAARRMRRMFGMATDGETAGEQPTPERDGAPERLPDLEGYEVLNQLRPSGQGIVCQARHRTTRRLVALKMMRRPDDPAALERFRREFR